MIKTLKKKRLGLALGGGGARGLAQIGVLKVLEQEGIPVHLIAGTSIGALIGAAYACGISTEELMERADRYLKSEEFKASVIESIAKARNVEELGLADRIQSFLRNRFFLIQAMFRNGIVSEKDFQIMISHFVPDIEIQQTRILFRAVSTNLFTGEMVVLSKGSLRKAVMGSCAVPGPVEPIRYGNWLLVDGGITCPVPSAVVKKEGCSLVVAVVVDRKLSSESDFRNVREVHYRASEIQSHELEYQNLKDADIVIRPEVGNLHWSDFSHARSLVEEGEKAVRENLKKIKKAMSLRRRWFR